MFALLAATVLAVSPPLNPVSPRLVTVSGDARLTFPANQVTLSLRTTARDRDEKTATRTCEDKQRKLVAAVQGAGADPRAVQLFDNGVSPEYRGNEVIAHVSTRTVVVVVTDLAKVDAILTAAGKQGASVFGPLLFAHTDQAAFDLKVRTLAAAQARARATAMLEALGGKLGLPRVVTDTTIIAPVTASRMVVPNADGSFVSNAGSVELTVASHLNVQFDVRDEG